MPTLLVITVLLPLVGGLALFALPGLDYRRARAAAIGVVLATLAASLILAASFDPAKAPGTLAPRCRPVLRYATHGPAPRREEDIVRCCALSGTKTGG